MTYRHAFVAILIGLAVLSVTFSCAHAVARVPPPITLIPREDPAAAPVGVVLRLDEGCVTETPST